MFLLHKATQVTATSGDDERAGLRELYAYPSARADGRPRIRANMVCSLDGAATADGRSGGLGGPGDRLIFTVLRELCDAILVGARTAIVENYHVPQPRPDGRRPALVLASRSLDIPDEYAVAADAGTLIATCANAPHDARERLARRGATLVDCGTDTVEPALLAARLGERGLLRVLCEGGPRLLADLVAAGVVDQLALTTAPLLAGGDGPRIAHGAAAAGGPAAATRRHLLGDDNGYLYALYDVGASAAGADAGTR